MSPARRDGEDLVLECLLQPRASREGLAGEHDGLLKVRVTAPPLEGKANAALIKLLAKQFGVARGAVCIDAGETARRKRVRIRAPQRIPEEVAALIR